MITKEKILAEILDERVQHQSFDDLVKGFEEKFAGFNPIENCFPINKYFGEGNGFETALSLILKDKVIPEDCIREYQTKKGRTKRDFKGLYVFVHEVTPFYVGISGGVIGRILQHVKGASHNAASMAFKIAAKLMNHTKERKTLPFEHVREVQRFLLEQKIAFIPIENDDELALFEMYCSMKLGTGLNSFETH